MERPGRYTLVVLLLVAIGLTGVLFVNLVVDPYDIHGLVTVQRLNATRPEQIFHDRMHKAHEVRRTRPDGVLLGTSRTQVGLDPHSPAFAGTATAVVNSALSDGQPWEALRYLQHAHALRPQQVAIMGLDYLSFDVGTRPNEEFLDARLAVDERGEPQRLSGTVDLIPTLLSDTALRASLHTFRKQHQPSYFRPGGQRDTSFMEARIEEKGGARKNFLASEREYLSNYACHRGVDVTGRSKPLADLARLVALARDQRIPLRLFFSPSHARSQLVVRAVDLWPAQEAWQRAVLDVVATAGQGADVQVWDFTGAGRYTGEPVPPLDDERSRMQWYWESSHYKSAVGELVLARVLGRPVPAEDAGFGVRLTADNHEAQLLRVRGELDAYAAAHPDDVNEIRALAHEVVTAAREKKHCGPPMPVTPLRWGT